MNSRPFGTLGSVSTLTLGGGGLGQLWGPTTREECVAVAREAPELGITLLDLAPQYGQGEAERVVGEAFQGKLPDGVRITTKCRVLDTPADEIPAMLEQSLADSMERMKLDHVDAMFLHNWVVDDGAPLHDRGTYRSVVESTVIPTFEKFVAEGRIGAWGLTGIGEPGALISLLDDGAKPGYIQIMANLLDSPGGLQYPDTLARPREIMAAAKRAGASIMGIRAVQAGALTSEIDRYKPPEHQESLDFIRAAPFRAIAIEVGQSPAFLAHQYALSIDGPATIVLGVKNREELRECVAAEAAGPMDPALMARIDAAVGRAD